MINKKKIIVEGAKIWFKKSNAAERGAYRMYIVAVSPKNKLQGLRKAYLYTIVKINPYMKFIKKTPINPKS